METTDALALASAAAAKSDAYAGGEQSAASTPSVVTGEVGPSSTVPSPSESVLSHQSSKSRTTPTASLIAHTTFEAPTAVRAQLEEPSNAIASTITDVRNDSQTTEFERPPTAPPAHASAATVGQTNSKHSQESKDSKRPIRCNHDGCDASFANSTGLRYHVSVRHTGVKPYSCSWAGCTKRFAQRSTLVEHYRIHTGEKPFACNEPGCTGRFTQRSTLIKHMRTHKRAKAPGIGVGLFGSLGASGLPRHSIDGSDLAAQVQAFRGRSLQTQAGHPAGPSFLYSNAMGPFGVHPGQQMQYGGQGAIPPFAAPGMPGHVMYPMFSPAGASAPFGMNPGMPMAKRGSGSDSATIAAPSGQGGNRASRDEASNNGETSSPAETNQQQSIFGAPEFGLNLRAPSLYGSATAGVGRTSQTQQTFPSQQWPPAGAFEQFSAADARTWNLMQQQQQYEAAAAAAAMYGFPQTAFRSGPGQMSSDAGSNGQQSSGHGSQLQSHQRRQSLA